MSESEEALATSTGRDPGPLRAFAREVGSTCWVLIKAMVPIALLMRVLELLGAVELIAQALAPLMLLVGLPSAMGLVWAAGIATNIYGALAAYAALAAQNPLTAAQVTVLGILVLTAHALPLEAAIARQAGLRASYTVLLRLLMALGFGAVLALSYQSTGTLQQTIALPEIAAMPPASGWVAWTLALLRQLAVIVAIVTLLLLFLRLLRLLRIDALLAFLLRPLLRLVGIERDALPMTLIGGLLGLSYGGGLLIAEARSGRMPRRQILLAMSFICLCHSLIEDTLLLAAIGAHWSGIAIGRTLGSLLVIAALAAALRRWPTTIEALTLTKELRHSQAQPAPATPASS